MDKPKYTTVSIPTHLAERIKERMKGTGFKSVSDYVTFVLREVVASTGQEKEKPVSKEDEKVIKQRLRGLGYLE